MLAIGQTISACLSQQYFTLMKTGPARKANTSNGLYIKRRTLLKFLNLILLQQRPHCTSNQLLLFPFALVLEVCVCRCGNQSNHFSMSCQLLTLKLREKSQKARQLIISSLRSHRNQKRVDEAGIISKENKFYKNDFKKMIRN